MSKKGSYIFGCRILFCVLHFSSENLMDISCRICEDICEKLKTNLHIVACFVIII